MISSTCNVHAEILERVGEILGLSEGVRGGMYLGFPSMIRKWKREILGFTWDKILSRIHNWNNMFLSRARRVIILKMVIFDVYAI